MKTVKKSMVKTMNQSISRFLGRLAKSFGGEEDQEVILQNQVVNKENKPDEIELSQTEHD